MFISFPLFRWLICLIVWLYMIPLSSSGQKQDCRLDKDKLEPIILRYNPFFADHKWNKENRMEIARMGPGRLVIVTQDGCKRHHTRFHMMISPQLIQQTDSFWIAEVKSLLHKIHFNRKDYEIFAEGFEKLFVEKFKLYGIGRQFNFPIGTRNFICEVHNNPEKGGRIAIEMVTFIFREKIENKRIGIPDEEDDGWYSKKKND